MRRAHFILLGLLTIALAAPAFAEGSYIFEFSTGTGLPVGWWGERWGMIQSGEINLKYDFDEGTGFFLLTGLDKTYFSKMSADEIANESRFRDVHQTFKPYTHITKAKQDGSFKQLPIGFGFYQEQEIAGYRAWGSAGMVVYLWRVERGQEFEEFVAPPGQDTSRHADNWWDEQSGSNVGFQFALGALYPLKKDLNLDLSVTYNLVSISKDNAALVYWGNPTRDRNWRPEVKSTTKTGVNYLMVRLGIRFGK